MAKKKKTVLNVGSQPTTLALKFYVEQLMPAPDRLKYVKMWKIKDKNSTAAAICKFMEHDYCDKFRKVLENFSYGDYFVAGIYHDKDMIEDDGSPFKVSSKKGHWHVIIWRDSWKSPKKRFRVATVTKKLGLDYAPELDTSLWKNHGAEVIAQGIPSYFAYLPHETDQAIKDGKHQYGFDEIVTNFSDEMGHEIMAYYQKSKKKSSIDWDLLAESAYRLGLSVGDYDSWVDSKLDVKQQAQSVARKVHDKYEKGLAEGIEKIGYIRRCSILICGEGNEGKSYTTAKALQDLGLKTYQAREGTGKYDGLSATDQAMTFDDVGVSQPLSVFDNRAVVLHRRNSGDRPWLGSYAIAITNSDSDTALMGMLGYRVQDPLLLNSSQRSTLEALRSRLYICHIENGELYVDQGQHRGSQEDHDEHDMMMIRFIEAFDNRLKEYKKDKPPVSKLEMFFKEYGR